MIASATAAHALLSTLVTAGVTDVVVCPGSRSAPLALAAQHLANAGRLRLHVRVDERSAGFLAVGLGMGTRRPAAVITTSGTAAANLHPAVLEASHAHVPLLVLTADRPPELRGVGANQTIDQPGLFGYAVRWDSDLPTPRADADHQGAWTRAAHDAVTAALGRGRPPGPVQLNCSFAEPLVPEAMVTWPT